MGPYSVPMMTDQYLHDWWLQSLFVVLLVMPHVCSLNLVLSFPFAIFTCRLTTPVLEGYSTIVEMQWIFASMLNIWDRRYSKVDDIAVVDKVLSPIRSHRTEQLLKQPIWCAGHCWRTRHRFILIHFSRPSFQINTMSSHTIILQLRSFCLTQKVCDGHGLDARGTNGSSNFSLCIYGKRHGKDPGDGMLFLHGEGSFCKRRESWPRFFLCFFPRIGKSWGIRGIHLIVALKT